VTAAKKLGEVTVLCAGARASGRRRGREDLPGVAKVLCAEDASLGHRLAEPTAALIVKLAGGYSHICWRRRRPTPRTSCRASPRCSTSW
jgi:electron transfer flavoprotein alpha subunit